MANVSVRIDEEDRVKLQQIADEFDVTISWVVRRAIKQYLAKESKDSETGDNLFFESNGIDGQVGPSTSSDNT